MVATLALSSLMVSAADKDAKIPVAIAVSDSAWSSTLFGTGIKTNDEYTDGNIFLTVPVWSTIGRDGTLGGNYLFIEPYTSIGDEGEVASSLGLSYRHLFSREPASALQKRGRAAFFEEGWFAGGSLFVDMLNTQRDNKFWQLGVGAEVGTRYLELRGNYYIPLTSQKLAERNESTQTFTSSSTTYKQTDSGSAPNATGNQIVQDVNLTTSAITTTSTTTVHTVTEVFEKGMEGWDAEMSLLLPWVDQWMDVKLIGGYFSFDNQPFGPQEFGTGHVHGWKLGAEVRPVPAVVLSGYWYEDKRFTGADWTVGVQLQVPLDRTWKDAFKMRRRHLVEHLAEPVHRQNDAIKVGNTKEQNSTSTTSVARVTRVVSQTKQHVVLADDVIFVNNGGPVGNGIQAGDDVTGDGTAEKPKATIQAGADIAATNNIGSGRVWNVYTQHSATNYAEDVAITESVNFISSATPLMGQGGRRFGSGLMPVLDGSFATCGCIPLGYVGITGYEIHGSSFAAIDMVNVQTLKIASNKISNPVGMGISVFMTNGNEGSAEITGNVITQSGAGMDGLSFFVEGLDSFLDATVTANTISGSGNAGVGFRAQDEALADLLMVGNHLFSNATSGLSVILDVGDVSASFANNQFNSNLGHGVDIFLDNESLFDFESVGDTFSFNVGDGLHIESNNESEMFPSVVSHGEFKINGGRPLEAITVNDGYLDLSVESSMILSTNGAGVHGLAGDGTSGFPNVSLAFFDSMIDVSGPGVAVGIQIESPLTGVAALGLFNTNVTVNGVTSTGVSLIASGTSCGCFPTIGAQIYDSTINVVGSTSSIGLDLSGSGASFIALDMDNTGVTGGSGVHITTIDDAFVFAGITESNITSDDKGIEVLSFGTDGVQIGVFDSRLMGGIYLTEGAGSTLDALVSGNNILPNSSLGAGIRFDKSGDSTLMDITDNVVANDPYGIYIGNSSATSFTLNVTGNQSSSPVFGLMIDNQGSGDITANINANTIFGFDAIVFSTHSTGAIHVNPSPTVLESNTVGGTKHVLTQPGILGPVDGTIEVNGATIVLPATVP